MFTFRFVKSIVSLSSLQNSHLLLNLVCNMRSGSQTETGTKIALCCEIIQPSVGFELKGCVVMNQYAYPPGGQEEYPLFILQAHRKGDTLNIINTLSELNPV